MEIETKLQVLEDEFRLMKGELKQALTDVRDFLVTFPAPAINEGVFERFHEMQKGMGGGGGNRETPAMVLPAFPEKTENMLSADLEVPEAETENEATPEETEQPENLEPGEAEVEEAPDTELEEATAPEARADEELPVAETADGMNHPAPEVNVLTNLIRWVSVAKRELGKGQLAAFLDVYGPQGALPPETRQLILQLAEVIDTSNDETTPSASFFALLIREQLSALLEVRASSSQISPELKDSIMNLVSMMAEPPPRDKPADVWSRLILELHGIISYGDAPIPPPVFRPGAPAGEILQPVAAKGKLATAAGKYKTPKKPMRLKLIMPVGKGVEKEFVFHLDPKKADDEVQAQVKD